MNREDVIRMASEAGFVAETVCFRDTSFPSWPQVHHDGPNGCLRELELFADLVAAAEREACAMACEAVEEAADKLWDEKCDPHDQGCAHGASACAAAIRDRSHP